MNKKVLTVGAMCLVTLGAYLPASHANATSSPKSPTHVVVATGFIPNVMYAPYYVAQDLGYYKAAGLDVEMNYDRLPNILQQVGDGKFAFAVTSGDSIIPARAQGIPVQYVMAQYQKYPIGAMTLASGGVPLSKPSDLKGRNVGFSGPNGPTYIGLRALLKAGKLSESDITETNIGFTETEALINHRIDVAMTFIDNEPVQAKFLGYPVKVLSVSKWVSLVSTGIATSDSTIKKHPKLVQGFVTATLKGLRYTLKHPNRAFAIAMKRQPEITDPAKVQIQRQVLSARLKFQQPPKGHPLGWSNPKSWQTTIKFLRSIGVVKQSVSVKKVYSSVFTNNFAQKAKV